MNLLVTCVTALSVVACVRAGCMCTYNAPNGLTVRDAPYGSILDYLANGDCVVTTGETAYNGGYWRLAFYYDSGVAWSASNWLQAGSNCGSCSAVSMVSRAGWEARSSTLTSMTTPVDHAFIHHTVTPRCYTQSECSANVRSIQNYHMDTKGWSDIGYSFLVGDDGTVYEGRGWNNQGAHTYGYNTESVGISLIGNFETSSPSAAMIDAVQALLLCGQELGYLTALYTLSGHRDVNPSTLCPGINLYNEIQTWDHYGKP